MATLLNCFEKKVYFEHGAIPFEVDLTEGDLEDSWNCITMPDGTLIDFNFHWDEDADSPVIELYEVLQDEEGNLQMGEVIEVILIKPEEIVGTIEDYFKEK